MSSQKCSLFEYEILLGISLAVIRAWNNVATHTREIIPVARVVWRLVVRFGCFLGHDQFPVSTQHHVRARMPVYSDICSPEHFMPIVCFGDPRFEDSPLFSLCISLRGGGGVIASVRYTKLLLRDLDPP